MKPAIVLSAAILLAAIIVSNSLGRLQRTLDFQARNIPRSPGFPSQITVVPPNGGFRVVGDFQRSYEPAPGVRVESQDPFTNVSNVWLVESRVTPAQLAAAPRTLVGRWRDENSYAEYRADHTCTWLGDNGKSNTYQWRIEGDTLFETHSDGHKVQRRILELDDGHFVYQQFPAGNIWRAARVADSPQVEKGDR
jgi:hypothetical protein